MSETKTAIAYLRAGQRVSVERQRLRIEAYAAREGLAVEYWWIETNPVSDVVEDRPVLRMAIMAAKSQGRTLLMDCIGRLSYKADFADSILKQLRERGVHAICVVGNLRLGSDDVMRHAQAQFAAVMTEYLSGLGPDNDIL